jgi:3-hydroxyisobutyrate dehydrogenase-like beta-hydroxyacid dehydrogenase
MSNHNANQIGLIGVGLMGHGIALNLAKKGQKLTILEHVGNQPIDDLVALGVNPVKTLAEIVAASDIIFLCVTGSPQVEAIILGEDGKKEESLLAFLKPGSLVVDCSTAQPASTAKVSAAVIAAGSRFVDAAMTRTPKEAAEGRLNLLLGGKQEDIDRVMPALKCIAENIYQAGDIGSGHALKLLHNYVSLGSISLIAEAAACGAVMGVGSDVFVKVLAEGGGGGIALERLRSMLLNRDPSGLKFSLMNAKKDIDYYNQMATEATGVSKSIAEGVKATLDKAAKKATPETLTPELITLLAPEK